MPHTRSTISGVHHEKCFFSKGFTVVGMLRPPQHVQQFQVREGLATISFTDFHQGKFVGRKKFCDVFHNAGLPESLSRFPLHVTISRFQMTRAGEILGKVVRRMDRPEAVQAWLVSSWTTIVGKTLAAHTRPIRCENGSLEIVADGKGWRKQLENMKAEFCERINQAWGGKLVREIKFVSKPGPKRVSRELDNEHTPFVRKRRSS